MICVGAPGAVVCIPAAGLHTPGESYAWRAYDLWSHALALPDRKEKRFF